MMFRQFWLWAAALPALALAGEEDVFFMGDGTGNSVGQAAAAKCNSAIGDDYAALNNDQWNSTLNCGKCVEVSCDDYRCSGTSAMKLFIVDTCTDCEDESLDVSPTVFKKLTGSSDPSRFSMKWKFTDCPGSISNSFNALTPTGAGSGKHYHAGKVSPADETPTSVTILQANAEGVEKTSTTATQPDESESQNSPGTSPFFIALGVLAVVCAVALAAVSYSAKKKRWNDKGECVTKSFDHFSSPAQAKATIVKI